MFPDGAAGIALLLLRAVVGVTAAVQGGTSLGGADPSTTMWASGCAAIAAGALLVIGFVTPAAAGLAGLSLLPMVLAVGPAADPGPFIDRVGAACVVAVAAALIALGPGSISVDARLFGRREIVFSQGRHDRPH